MLLLQNVLGFSISSMPVKISLLVTALALLYFYLAKKFRRDPRLVKLADQLPGPTALPLIGNGLDFFMNGTKSMKVILEYTEKYGHVFRLWFGTHLIVGLSKAEDLEVVFGSSKMLGKPELFRPFRVFWGDSLFTAPMHVWKKNRKRFQPIFGNNMMSIYTPAINEKIYSAIETMKKLLNRPEFDTWDYLPYLSFDVITKTLLNVELDWNDKSSLKFHNCIKIAMETSFQNMFRPWLHIKFIRNLLHGNVERHVRGEMLKFSQNVVKDKLSYVKEEIQRKKNAKTPAHEDLSLGTFLTKAYELNIETQNEKIMHDEIIVMITGGTDTVAITNSFFLLAIAIHKDIQQKLYDEIYEIFGNDDRHADDDDIKRLPYLDQVLKETSRRFTVTPAIFREVEEDCKIGEYFFPAGTGLMISVAGVHFNPEYYPDPFKFNPENFSSEAVGKRHKLTFLSFSAGSRNCIGQNYAMLEMKLTLIALLRNYSFHTKMTMNDIKMSMGFIMTSANGYKLSIKPRIRKASYQ